jgi:ATP-dependent Lhr-like helicase
MAKRRFREVARVAGLVFVGYPGGGKNAKQLQASTGLLFDVFKNYDPSNLLLRQAENEVLDRQLDAGRLAETLRRLESTQIAIERPRRPTPLAFPLLVDRLRERLSSEKLADRVRRMTRQLERAAGT